MCPHLQLHLVQEFYISYQVQNHLPHVLAIPGITGARQLHHTQDPPGTHTMVFEIADGAAVETVLASSEAQAARQDWDRWAAQIRELTIEVFAPLDPVPDTRRSLHHAASWRTPRRRRCRKRRYP